MRGLISFLATVWRIASPYFFLAEDRWIGRGLLAAVVAIELSIVGINVLLNQWNARFFNALQARDWNAFVYQLGYFCVLATIFIVLAVYQLYLNQWLQIRWRRWMTSQYLDHWLGRRQSLSHAVARRRRRQPRPAYRRGHPPLHRFWRRLHRRAADRPRTVERDRHARLLRRHPVVAVGGGAAAPVRSGVGDPRLSGLGGVDLRGDRHGVHTSDRAAADRAQFPAAALRSGFPLWARAGAREAPSRSRCSKASGPSATACSIASAA